MVYRILFSVLILIALNSCSIKEGNKDVGTKKIGNTIDLTYMSWD